MSKLPRRALRILRLLRLTRIGKLQKKFSILATRFLSTYVFMVLKAAWRHRSRTNFHWNSMSWRPREQHMLAHLQHLTGNLTMHVGESAVSTRPTPKSFIECKVPLYCEMPAHMSRGNCWVCTFPVQLVGAINGVFKRGLLEDPALSSMIFPFKWFQCPSTKNISQLARGHDSIVGWCVMICHPDDDQITKTWRHLLRWAVTRTPVDIFITGYYHYRGLYIFWYTCTMYLYISNTVSIGVWSFRNSIIHFKYTGISFANKQFFLI